MKLDVNINKNYKDFSLNVSFKGNNGCIGILGPSGCGKSMTLKSIAGIINPDYGQILLDDEVLFDSQKKINIKPQKRNIGYLFQNYALFPNMSVEQNIAAGLNHLDKKQRQQRVNEMISRFHLDGLSKRYPKQLSGGQQQRVALARIFAYEPKVLLLDEPFSAMDTHLRESLRLQLSEVLKEYNGISIMVTHDRDEVYQLCNQLIIIDKGSIIASGYTKDIFENPGNVTAARLTGCKNISRVEIIDENTIKALDWNNIELKVNGLTKDVTHIGIRAHDFYPIDTKEHQNSIEVGKAEISEMPFEWYITLENGIWWKLEKQIHEHTYQAPQYVSIDPDKILLLKD